MKKLFFIFIVCLCVLGCDGTSGATNPLTPRTVEVENTTAFSINIKVYTVHNSGLSFSGVINPGEKKVFSSVSECNVEPNSAYNWKLERSYDKNYQRFKFRNLTDGEKIKVSVYNHITYKLPTDVGYRITLSGKVNKDTNAHPFSKELNGVLLTVPANPPTITTVFLYDREYDLSLAGAKFYYKKKPDGSFDTSRKYPALQRNTVDNPPEWAADPNNPADKDKVPLFFTIDYNKSAKTINIKKVPTE